MIFGIGHRKKKQVKEIATSKGDFEREFGISMSDEQYKRICHINMMMIESKIPAYMTMILLREIGLLKSEPKGEVGNNKSDKDFDDDLNDGFYCEFGRVVTKALG